MFVETDLGSDKATVAAHYCAFLIALFDGVAGIIDCFESNSHDNVESESLGGVGTVEITLLNDFQSRALAVWWRTYLQTDTNRRDLYLDAVRNQKQNFVDLQNVSHALCFSLSITLRFSLRTGSLQPSGVGFIIGSHACSTRPRNSPQVHREKAYTTCRTTASTKNRIFNLL